MYKILAADIDMTLTSKGGALPKITMDAFEELHKQGALIGLATGRALEPRLYKMGRDWGLSFEFDFIIGMNGGQVYNRQKDSTWSIEKLSTDTMKEILNYTMPYIDKYKIAVNAEGGNTNAMNITGELLASARRHGFMFVDKTGDIDGFCDKPAFKFLFRMEPAFEQEFRDYFLKKFGDRFQIISTFPGTVEVFQKGVNKGSGLQRYAADMGVDMKDTIAFGDNENDNTLLEDAGLGVCLKNGADGTKAVADVITEYTCDEGGVGHFLFDHILNQK